MPRKLKNARQNSLKSHSSFGLAHLWCMPRAPLQTTKLRQLAFTQNASSWVQTDLGVHFLKLAQTRYQSVDGQNRMVCAVSTEHNETGGTPYFWFAFHKTQLDFLQQAGKAWLCLGCGSAETTLLIGLPEIANKLALMSVVKADDRHYWHIVIAKRMGHLVLRLRGGTDGPDLTGCNISTLAKQR